MLLSIELSDVTFVASADDKRVGGEAMNLARADLKIDDDSLRQCIDDLVESMRAPAKTMADEIRKNSLVHEFYKLPVTEDAVSSSCELKGIILRASQNGLDPMIRIDASYA